MKTWMTAAAALLALPAMAATPDDKTLPAHFHGTVRVAADGTVEVLTLDGVEGRVADAVRDRVQALRAEPAQSAGAPAEAIAPLSGRVVLTPLDDARFDVGVDQIALQAAPIKRSAISYPLEAMRRGQTGAVELEFALDAKGAPTGVKAVGAPDRVFKSVAIDALRRWRYAPDAIDASRRLRMAFVFSTGSTVPTPVFECPIDPAHPRLAGETTCIDRLTVTGTLLP